MVNQQVTKQKATGSHFTPTKLAQYVSEKIVSTFTGSFGESVTILDPACGNGELLRVFAETLPPQQRVNLNLVGIDSEKIAFTEARSRLKGIGVHQIDLRLADFLSLYEQSIDADNQSSLIDSVDIIIANPPYVRTQILGSEKAQKLVRLFQLSGRVDLYHAFLVAMTYCLKPGGVLGVITSNRFISTKGGKTLRQFLAKEYDIAEITDLGDTKLFEAAVLPAVFVGIRKQNRIFYFRQKVRFLKIYESTTCNDNRETHSVDSIYAALQNNQSGIYATKEKQFELSVGTLEIPADATDNWVMVTDSEKHWVQSIQTAAWKYIQDLTKVRVGVKTTADDVFIRRNWKDLEVEEEILFPLYSNEDADKWSSLTSQDKLKQLLYTHQMHQGKRIAIDLSHYPGAAAYLEGYREQLSGRQYVADAKRNWYEIWVPQNPAAWASPKIVFPDISPNPRFFYDEMGAIVDGNCYWITLESPLQSDLLFLILGIANTELMTKYHDLVFNNKLYSGRRRYLAQYVERYPLPDPKKKESIRIIEIAKELSTGQVSYKRQLELEQLLEAATTSAFGLQSPTD